MRKLVESARQSMDTGNWYACLSTVLTFPDICAGLEVDTVVRGTDYMDWCDRFVVPIYDEQHNVDFISSEIYALRCAYLHQGSSEIENQKKRQHIKSYLFVLPLKDWSFGTRVVKDMQLLIEVSMFCRVLIEATEHWIETVLDVEEAVQARASSRLLAFVDPKVDGIPL